MSTVVGRSRNLIRSAVVAAAAGLGVSVTGSPRPHLELPFSWGQGFGGRRLVQRAEKCNQKGHVWTGRHCRRCGVYWRGQMTTADAGWVEKREADRQAALRKRWRR